MHIKVSCKRCNKQFLSVWAEKKQPMMQDNQTPPPGEEYPFSSGLCTSDPSYGDYSHNFILTVESA